MCGKSVLAKLLSLILIIGTIKISLPSSIHNFTFNHRTKYACDLTESYNMVQFFFPLPIENKISALKGIPLHLIIRVIDATTCSPLPNANVDIRHTNADTKLILKSVKSTDSQGDVRFTTIIPGWRSNEAIHISTIISLNNSKIYKGRLFFDENLSNASKLKSTLVQTNFYAGNESRYISYDKDAIYRYYFSNGDTLLSLTTIGTGFQAIVTIVVDPEKTMQLQ